MLNKFILCANLAVATITSFIDIIIPCATQPITMYICGHIPSLAGKAFIE